MAPADNDHYRDDQHDDSFGASQVKTRKSLDFPIMLSLFQLLFLERVAVNVLP